MSTDAQRTAFEEQRQPGIQARHRTKLARIGTIEQHGAALALAALNQDNETVARYLDCLDDQSARKAAAIALGAVSTLALNARPHSIARVRGALIRMEQRGPNPTDAA
ncbi:hypothetical protein [Streptomyces sp. bgisy031]|uniref:hypothetical protein n=1 Tax=Streptomyces sp. bgisy031 TaxID=3413772 RepID=UPI003D7059C4